MARRPPMERRPLIESGMDVPNERTRDPVRTWVVVVVMVVVVVVVVVVVRDEWWWWL
jgi:fatty acid desaturase